MSIPFHQTVQSFVQFLWNWKVSGGNLVDQNTANQRAETCVACHNNLSSKEVRKGGCGVCQKMGNATINMIRSKIIKGNGTPSDAKLLTCGICGCCLKISVWIPNAVLLKSGDANAYPEFCWKKKVVEGRDI